METLFKSTVFNPTGLVYNKNTDELYYANYSGEIYSYSENNSTLIQTGVKSAAGICMDSNNGLYVGYPAANPETQSIVISRKNFKGLTNPFFINNSTYVDGVDDEGNDIIKTNGSSYVSNITGIASDTDNNIYFTCASSGLIGQIDRNGRMHTLWRNHLKNNEEKIVVDNFTNKPYDIKVGPKSLAFSNILFYTNNGNNTLMYVKIPNTADKYTVDPNPGSEKKDFDTNMAWLFNELAVNPNNPDYIKIKNRYFNPTVLINASGALGLNNIWSGVGLNDPRGIAFDDNKNLYCANYTGGKITKYNFDTKKNTVYIDELGGPNFLACKGDGTLFCSCYQDNTIIIINNSGQKSTYISNNFVNLPNKIITDSENNIIWSTTYGLYKTNINGETLTYSNIFINKGDYSGPYDLTFDNIGNLYGTYTKNFDENNDGTIQNTEIIIKFSATDNNIYEYFSDNSGIYGKFNGIEIDVFNNIFLSYGEESGTILKINYDNDDNMYIYKYNQSISYPGQLKIGNLGVLYCLSNNGASIHKIVTNKDNINLGYSSLYIEFTGFTIRSFTINKLDMMYCTTASKILKVYNNKISILENSNFSDTISNSLVNGFGIDINSEGVLFCCNTSNNTISYIRSSKIYSDLIYKPQGITKDKIGNIYICNYIHNNIIKMHRTTNQFTVFYSNIKNPLCISFGNIVYNNNPLFAQLYILTTENKIFRLDIPDISNDNNSNVTILELASGFTADIYSNIICDDNDNIYITNVTDGNIIKYNFNNHQNNIDEKLGDKKYEEYNYLITNNSEVTNFSIKNIFYYGLFSPFGIAFNSSNKCIYVSNYTNNTIYKISMESKGEVFIENNVNLKNPKSIIFDNLNNLYCICNENTIIKIDQNKLITTIIYDPTLYLHTIILDSNNNIIAVDYSTDDIYRISQNGIKTILYSSKFKNITDIEFNNSGDLIATCGKENKLVKFNFNINSIDFYYESNNQIINPQGLYYNPYLNKVFFVNSGDSKIGIINPSSPSFFNVNSRTNMNSLGDMCIKYNSVNNYTIYYSLYNTSEIFKADIINNAISNNTLLLNKTNGINYPKGLTMDSSNNLYCANFGNNNIVKFNYNNGNYTYSNTFINNKLITPLYLCFDPTNTFLYCSTYEPCNICKFDKDGIFYGALVDINILSLGGITFDISGNLWAASTKNNILVKI